MSAQRGAGAIIRQDQRHNGGAPAVGKRRLHRNVLRSLFGDEIRDPRQVGHARRVFLELTVAAALAIVAFPVHAHLRETGLVQQLAQLGQRPQAPVVGERALDLRAVGELEVDVAEDAARHGLELGLLPNVSETVDLGLLLREVRRVGSAERVEEKHTVGVQRVMNASEVAAHLVARLETEVAEVERADDVDAIGSDVAHVVVQQLDPRARCLRQARDAIAPPPVEHVGIEIDADRVPARARAHPLASEAGGAAEIFAQAQRFAAAQRAKVSRRNSASTSTA